jgi:hypothetical protein
MALLPFLMLLPVILQLQQLTGQDAITRKGDEPMRRLLTNDLFMPVMPPFPYMPSTVQEAMQLIMWYRHNQRATFIQIGANDGVKFDPLYEAIGQKLLEARWIGLQVEPTPTLFANLTALHRNASGWSFYNGAMADSTLCINGTVTFMESPKSGVDQIWWKQGQVNTLLANTIHQKVLIPQDRPCLTSFESLLTGYASPEFLRHTLKNSKYTVDLLQIDVEGFDDKVIGLIDWNTLSPHCIHFESYHINATSVTSLLVGNGYTLRVNTMDTLACRVEPSATDNSSLTTPVAVN